MRLSDLNPDDIELAEGATPKLSSLHPDDISLVHRPGPEPGIMEAFGRGGAQIGSLGWADELAGGAGTARGVATGTIQPSDAVKEYIKNRDAYRERDDSAFKAHPWAYRVGEAAGLVPAAYLGTTSALARLGAAGMGALIGLGNSKADLTQPTPSNVGRAALDTGIGAVTGHAAGKLAGRITGSAAPAAESEAVSTAKPAANPFEKAYPESGPNEFTVSNSGEPVPSNPVPQPVIAKPAPAQTTNPIRDSVVNAVSRAAGGFIGHRIGGMGGATAGFAIGPTVAKGAEQLVARGAGAIIKQIASHPEAAIYTSAISAAAQRGQDAVNATNFILSQTSPAYRDATMKQADNSSP